MILRTKLGTLLFKVENLLKGSLDLISSPTPSVKVFLRCNSKTLLGISTTGHCQQTFENKKFVDITQQCFTLLPQVNFPASFLLYFH